MDFGWVWDVRYFSHYALLNLVPGSLSSASVVGTETLVAAGPRIRVVEKSSGRVGQQGFDCHIDKITKANVLEYPPTLRFWMDRGHVTSRNQGLCSND